MKQQKKDPQTQSSSDDVDLTLNQVRSILRGFVGERKWEKYHTPRNLVLAMVGEVGQVAEIFQWKGQVENGLPSFSEEEKVHVGEQLADVLSYLIRLGDVCGIDMSKALLDKVKKNAVKYPSDKEIKFQEYKKIKSESK